MKCSHRIGRHEYQAQDSRPAGDQLADDDRALSVPRRSSRPLSSSFYLVRFWPVSGTGRNHAGTSNDGGNHPPRGMVAMQRFIAELSKLVDKSEFERSWQSDTARKPDFKVEFGFSGGRVFITVHSDLPGEWPSDDLYRIFTAVIRRIDRSCNVRCFGAREKLPAPARQN